MNQRKIIFIASILLLVISTPKILAQTNSHPYDITKVGRHYGVFYNLPQTQLVVKVEAKKSTYIPGKLAAYAETYLHEKVSTKSTTTWTLNRFSASMIGIADTTKQYFIEMRDKTVAPLLTLDRNQMVVAINKPLATTTLEDASTLNPEDIMANEEHLNGILDSDSYQTEKVVHLDTLHSAKENELPTEYMTQEMMMATSESHLASLIADEIFTIRESRNLITRGQLENMPQDGAAIKLMLKNLSDQEDALSKLFLGSSSVETKTKTIKILPSDLTDKVIMRFSKYLGLIDADNLAGTPIVLHIKDLKTVNQAPEENEEKSSKDKKSEGIAYNIPGQAAITISYNGQTILSDKLPCTQFGLTDYLAPILFERKSTIQVTFDPITGALINIDKKGK